VPGRFSAENDAMKKLLLACTTVLLSALSTSCGSSGGTCGNTSPCGGDVTGAWTISSTCISASASSNMTNTFCPSASTGSSQIHATGNMTFRSDMTYTTSTTISGTVNVTIPASCLNQNGIQLTCAQLTQAFKQDPMLANSSCAGGTTCVCNIAIPSQTQTESGMYTTTAAGTLTFMPTTGTGESDDYCVKGNTLYLSPSAGSTMMGQSVTGTIVLSKS
jgi:hypothetical protein